MNEKTKYYYNDLPEDYIEDYEIDAKSAKFTVIYGIILNLLLTIGTIALCIVIKKISFNDIKDYYNLKPHIILLSLFILMVSMVAYIVLHELTHGLFYKIFTREKLTFGLTLTVAFCGVPKLYNKKWPMIITSLAPFVVFSFVFGIPLFFINDIIAYIGFSIMLGIHLGGCIGDLYGSIIMLFKYHGKNILVNDTGPKQTFYIKK